MVTKWFTCIALLPLFLLLFCAPAIGAAPKITKVQVTESTMASQVEILADTPLTYTYYTLSSPPRAIVDIALADPTQASRQQSVNSPLITGITLDRIETPPIPRTRVTIGLAHDAYLSVRSNPEDKGRLLVTLVKKIAPAPESAEKNDSLKDLAESDSRPAVPTATAPGAEPKEDPLGDLPDEKGTTAAVAGEKAGAPIAMPAPAVQPAVAPSPATALKESPPKSSDKVSIPDQKTVQSQSPKADLKPVVPASVETKTDLPMTVTANGVVLTGGTPTKAPRIFRLTGPNRLVIDMPGGKGVSRQKESSFERFGFKKVRVGFYQDKVRYVFDAGQAPLPAHRLEKSAAGLSVIFGR